MPLPAALAVIASVFSTAIGAYSIYAQGQAQARMANYNALIARQNAELERLRAEAQKVTTEVVEERHKKKTEEILATQRLLYGKAGVTMEGTPSLVLEETAAQAQIDALAIRYAASIEEAEIMARRAAYTQEAQLARMKEAAYRQAAIWGAGRELLTGISQFLARNPLGTEEAKAIAAEPSKTKAAGAAGASETAAAGV